MGATLHTGSAIAEALGTTPSTWGRWVKAGKAPKPAATASAAKLYDGAEVAAFCDGLRELAEGDQ